MHFPYRFIIVTLVFAAVLAAGCTLGTGPAVPVTPVPVTGPDLQNLALRPSEVPSCFSLTDQHVKSSGEVGQLAKDLGWQAGYQVMYTCPGSGPEPTVIIHSLAIYPAGNISGIASLVDHQDRSASYTYRDLSFPDKNSIMIGFFGKAGRTEIPGISAGTDVLISNSVPGTTAVSGSDVAEIIFYRGTCFNVMKMTGPGTNMTLLRDIALGVSAKIP